MQRIFDTSLLLFHLGLGCSADINDSHTARELGETLLQLLAIVVGGRFLDLTTNLADATLDVFRRAFTFNNGGILFVDRDLIPYEEVRRERVELPKRSKNEAYDDVASIANRRFVAEKY
jgi:hypothetical protein